MVDNDKSDGDFGKTTETHLNRLSYLILQMADKMVSTR